MWQLVEDDLESIAIGAAILGTSGGGNPYIGRLRARQATRERADLGPRSRTNDGPGRRTGGETGPRVAADDGRGACVRLGQNRPERACYGTLVSGRGAKIGVSLTAAPPQSDRSENGI